MNVLANPGAAGALASCQNSGFSPALLGPAPQAGCLFIQVRRFSNSSALTKEKVPAGPLSTSPFSARKKGKTPFPLSSVTACPQPSVPRPCSCSNAGNLLLGLCPFSWGHRLPLPDLLPFFPSLLPFLSGLLLLLLNLLLPGLVCWP